MTACPFNESICATQGIEIDSGLIDVSQSMGLNIIGNDNLFYRKRSVCSMLSLEGRTRTVNASDLPFGLILRDGLPGETYSVFEFGTPGNGGTGINATFGFSDYGSYFSAGMAHG